LRIDGHHLRHWAQGGSTDLANLVTICRAHHWKAHEGGWRLIRTDEGVVALPPVADDHGPARGSSRPRRLLSGLAPIRAGPGKPGTWCQLARRFGAVRIHAPLTVAAVALLASGGVAGCGTQASSLQVRSSAPSVGACSLSKALGQAGAPAGLGLDATGATAPAWSAQAGRLSVAVGGTAYGTEYDTATKTECIVAVDLATGGLEWDSPPPAGHPDLFGVIADGSTVLAPTGVDVGNAPDLVLPLVNQLAAYDSLTGVVRWTVDIPDDGQGIPALMLGGVVVVSEADGTLLGLSEGDGHQLWSDSYAFSCAGKGGTVSNIPAGTLAQVLGVLGAGPDVAVGYQCAGTGGGGVAAVDAATGGRVWSWPMPGGWEGDWQVAGTADSGATGGDVVAVPISQLPPANAPAVTTGPPGPLLPTMITNIYGYSEGTDVVVLDAASGQPLWDLENVAGQALSVLGGAGSLCLLTDAGADCRDALTGASLWSKHWPGAHASSQNPALDCIDMEMVAQPCAVSAGGLLYVALATDAAPGDANPPGPPESGIFVLTELDMATGATVASLPLPGFSAGPDGIGVSLEGPPAVVQVAGGMVLVSPQFQETDVVEAFAAPASG
jgi:outer membrane protein assembly factor BamB